MGKRKKEGCNESVTINILYFEVAQHTASISSSIVANHDLTGSANLPKLGSRYLLSTSVGG